MTAVAAAETQILAHVELADKAEQTLTGDGGLVLPHILPGFNVPVRRFFV